MKKIFKKSILIVICFILGSIACISVGVYAYSYAATDIEYTSGKSVKQAIDELYSKVKPDIFQFDNYGGACYSYNDQFHCFKVGEDNRSAEMEHIKQLFGESNCNSAGGYVYRCTDDIYEVGVIWNGGNIMITNCSTQYQCITTKAVQKCAPEYNYTCHQW